MLLLDNGSVYTKELVGFLDGQDVSFVRHTPATLDMHSLSSFDSFILSGRRHNDSHTNRTNSRIILHAVATGKKLLGICYGAEILALTLGGALKRSSRRHVGEQTITISHPNQLCSGSVRVFESHSFEISRIPNNLTVLGSSSNCEYEFIRHLQMPVFGTQFHPEMSPDGHCMIEKFCRL